MTLPHSEFAAAFRLHVTPRLRDLVIARSIEFWADDLGFVEIMAEVWCYALTLGGGFLPQDHQDALRDWLYAFLTEQIDAAEKIQQDADDLVLSLLREPSREVLRASVRGFVRAG